MKAIIITFNYKNTKKIVKRKSNVVELKPIVKVQSFPSYLAEFLRLVKVHLIETENVIKEN